jgi:hypothetical protein
LPYENGLVYLEDSAIIVSSGRIIGKDSERPRLSHLFIGTFFGTRWRADCDPAPVQTKNKYGKTFSTCQILSIRRAIFG